MIDIAVKAIRDKLPLVELVLSGGFQPGYIAFFMGEIKIIESKALCYESK